MKTFNVTYRTMTGRKCVHTVEAEDHHGAHVAAVSDLGINFGDVVKAECQYEEDHRRRWEAKAEANPYFTRAAND